MNAVNHTQSTRTSNTQQVNYSIWLSALNLGTNKSLISNPATATHFKVKNNSYISASNTSPQTPARSAGRMKFQSTPNLAVNSTRLSNEGPMTPNLEFSQEESFNNNLTQLFTQGFLAVLTSKNAVLKKVRDCILQIDEQRCKDVNPYLPSYWR